MPCDMLYHYCYVSDINDPLGSSDSHHVTHPRSLARHQTVASGKELEAHCQLEGGLTAAAAQASTTLRIESKPQTHRHRVFGSGVLPMLGEACCRKVEGDVQVAAAAESASTVTGVTHASETRIHHGVVRSHFVVREMGAAGMMAVAVAACSIIIIMIVESPTPYSFMRHGSLVCACVRVCE